jgi:hypothetical protein
VSSHCPFTGRWKRRPWRLSHAEKLGSRERPSSKETRRRSEAPRKRMRRQRCQRLDRNGRRGKITPTLASAPHVGTRGRGKAARVQLRSAEAVSGVVKHPVPRKTVRSPRLHAVSAPRKRPSEPGTHEVRVHADRSGGRSRSDASRALAASGSQGLVAESAGR